MLLNIAQNGLGDVARRIDQRDIVSRGFPANYFRVNPQFSQIFYLDSGGDSFYHGFIAGLRRRFEKGLELGLAYTLSKSIDNMSSDPALAVVTVNATNARTPTDVRNFRLDRSLSDFDNTHVLVTHAVYEVPLGRGRKWASSLPSWANQILGGWTVTGIHTYESGEPCTINSGVRTANGFKQTRAELQGPMPPSYLQFVPGIEGPVMFSVSDLDPNTNCRQVIGTQSLALYSGAR